MIQIKGESEIDELKSIFDKTRKLVISNIFKEDEINKLHLFLTRLLPQFWICATCVKKDRMELPLNDKRNILRIKMAQEAFSKNEFSYYFYRTFNANPTQYSIIEYNLRNYMNSPEFISFLNNITNLNLTKLTTLFVSKYVSNSFLSIHNDAGNGKIAFVLHLTKDWKPQYGGNLHFLNNDRTHIIETFNPQFNSLMLFEIPPENGIPHFVSHVAPNVPIQRISITGWYE
jgi:Rps23 Pro-64 3,4-dihydroxylase Tpa1-like proline 4-hydroxylase